MRKYIKTDLCNIIEQLASVNETLINKGKDVPQEQVQEILTDCQQGAVDVGNKIEEVEGEGTEAVHLLEEYCEKVYLLCINWVDVKLRDKELKNIRILLNKVKNSILYAIKDSKKEVVFLPYKASMWTSLESIWKAADEDPDCTAVVMPIPYFKIGAAHKELKMEYEGDLFPEYVPIVDWKTYSLESAMPDAIFIHNPYDDGNRLTTVHPNYYSTNLKRCTSCLVYSPYFTMCGYRRGTHEHQYINKGTINADKVIVQSDFVKKIYESYGFCSDKLVVTGSPKTDAVIRRLNQKIDYPKGWREKLEGKKVFLLNTHLSYFPAACNASKIVGYDYAQKFCEEILEAIHSNNDCALIWRPHPLLFSHAANVCPESLIYLNDFKKRICESDRCVLDETADYIAAFHYSDAMITTYSSLLNEYFLTGKPVQIMQYKQSDDFAETSPVDARVSYFRYEHDGGMTFDSFVKMICRGEDPKKEERMDMVNNRPFANLDGTAGAKAYKEIKKYLETL